MLGKDGYNPSGMSAQISGDLENTHRDAGDEATQKFQFKGGPVMRVQVLWVSVGLPIQKLRLIAL